MERSLRQLQSEPGSLADEVSDYPGGYSVIQLQNVKVGIFSTFQPGTDALCNLSF